MAARFDESLFMRIPDLNLDLVRCFVTVVETGGFTQASKRLHLTQSAITQKIKRLENLLQRRLFVRTIKPFELSAEGEILLTYAPRLLGLSREMVQRVSKPPQNEALRLGIVEQFGYHFLPVWLSELKREWPDVRLVSDMGVTTDPLKGLEEDRFDLVIASAGYTTMARSKSASLLQEQHLQKETLVWVQAEKSKIDSKKDPLPLVMLGPLSRYRPIALEALRKEGRSSARHRRHKFPAVESCLSMRGRLRVLPPHSIRPEALCRAVVLQAHPLKNIPGQRTGRSSVRRNTPRYETVLSGTLDYEQLQVNGSTCIQKFYQKFYFVPSCPKPFTGVQIV